MNYNARPTGRQSFGKKVKRVSDVNSMGYSPYDPGNVSQQNLYPNLNTEAPNTNHFQTDYGNQQPYINQEYATTPQAPNYSYNNVQNYPAGAPILQPTQMGGVFGQPIVQDMAFQYGQQLAGAGQKMIKEEVGRYIPVNKLKYYFAVDTKYVLRKLLILFFPFTHSDWSIKYEQDGPVQPRFEINAPDLYIPTMAYITYVLVSGLVLGMQQRFTPEQIGILASSALAWCVVELAIYSATLYIIQVQTSLRTLDLLAYSGYKFVGIIISILINLIGGRSGYFAGLIYCNMALAFFLVRALKAQVLAENSGDTSQPGYYQQQPQTGHKRRLYFLLFVAAVQPILSWWLSFHLLATPTLSSPSKDV